MQFTIFGCGIRIYPEDDADRIHIYIYTQTHTWYVCVKRMGPNFFGGQ